MSADEEDLSDAATNSSSSSSLWWIHPTCRDLYIQHIFPSGAARIKKRARLLRYSLHHAWGTVRKRCHHAQFLEFGVHEGKDLVRMAYSLSQLDNQQRTNTGTTIIHGFDSFQGLPEDWNNGQNNEDDSLAFAAGAFDLDGVAPILSSVRQRLNLGANEQDIGATVINAKLHPGWFSDTIPSFLKEHPAPIAFVHADADLYASTMTFLDEICKQRQLVQGTVITFDEYANYENWQEGEYRAWKEICETYSIKFRYLCYHAPAPKDLKNWYGYQSVSVVLTSVGK
jgi:hypothetical protein